MKPVTTQMSENGRLVLPVAIRRAAGLKPGETLSVWVDAEGIHLQTRRQALARLRARVKGQVSEGRSLAAELLSERRREAAPE
jgi:AbrB family looped-hinge helix DNA binding protein